MQRTQRSEGFPSCLRYVCSCESPSEEFATVPGGESRFVGTCQRPT